MAKTDPIIVELIRYEYENDITSTAASLALKYGVSYTLVREILCGKKYTNLAGKIWKRLRNVHDSYKTYVGDICIEHKKTKKRIFFKNTDELLDFFKHEIGTSILTKGIKNHILRQLHTQTSYRGYKFLPVENAGLVKPDKGFTILSSSDVEDMRRLYFDEKMTVSQLCKKYNLSSRTIERLLKGLSYKSIPGKTSRLLWINRKLTREKYAGVPMIAKNTQTGNELYFSDMAEAAEYFFKYSGASCVTNVYNVIRGTFNGKSKSAYGHIFIKLE